MRKLEKNLERITIIKPFINKYNQKGAKRWLEKKWENNPAMFCIPKKSYIYLAYISKHNSTRGKKVIL